MKTLLIGWDAADWRAITPLLDEGKMPNLQRLMNEGVSGNITTLNPILSPMLWSSIATGKRPYKHGVHGFSEPDPVSGAIRPVTNLSRKCKAIWNILNQSEKDTITVGWWPSNPAEPLSRGVMVSNDYQRTSVSKREGWLMPNGTVHPERLVENLKEIRFHPEELNSADFAHFIPAMKDMSEEELRKLEKDPRLQSLGKIIADCTSIHAAATALMQNEPWDLMSVYYDAIDHFGHAFMKYHPPQRANIEDWDYKVFHYIVEAGYIYHDMLLGTLMQLAGEGTNIILISDHGFHPDAHRLDSIPNEPAGPAAEHRSLGVFIGAGPQFKVGEKIYGANLLDICPTLLHCFGLPIGNDMDGKVLMSLFKDNTEVKSISSWEDVAGDDGMHSPDRTISPEDSKAAIDQLVALGYIEEPNADKSMALEQTVRELDYNLAQAYMDGGIFSEALIILERLYEKWPMEYRFGIKLSYCYLAFHRYKDQKDIITGVIASRVKVAEEAFAELKRLKLDSEEGAKAYRESVDAMEDKEQRAHVKKHKDLLSNARPNLYALHSLEATADFASGNYAEALEKLETLSKHHGERLDGLILKGNILARMRRFDKAERFYREGLGLDSESAACFSGLGRVAMARKDFESAVSYLQQSLEISFSNPRGHYMLGVAHLRLHDNDTAEACFKVSLNQAPLNPAAWRGLVQIAQYHRRDPHQTVFFKEQVKESRKRLKHMAHKKYRQANAAATKDDERQPMPELSFDTSKLEGVGEENIITIVSGLPRSGTSLMMQMLEAAGVGVFQDGKRKADDSNQKGYYEHESVMHLLTAKPVEKGWVAKSKGQALKVVAPLLSSLPIYDQFQNIKKAGYMGAEKDAVRLNYRVVFMERPMEQVLLSQSSMLVKLGKEAPKGDPTQGYRQQVRAAKAWLLTRNIPAMSVDYPTLVKSPDSLLTELVAFLGCPEKVEEMREVIDPKLHRQRSRSSAS
ncbi:MAG: alkaline phosphatase family protein [Akkermansiaceae bacterium]